MTEFSLSKILLFDDQQSDADSPVFTPTFSDSKNFAKKESYLEVYGGAGGLGGGTLIFKKRVENGDFKEMEKDSLTLNADFPTTSDKMQIFPFDFEDAGEFQISLSGSTSPNLFIYAINCKLVT